MLYINASINVVLSKCCFEWMLFFDVIFLFRLCHVCVISILLVSMRRVKPVTHPPAGRLLCATRNHSDFLHSTNYAFNFFYPQFSTKNKNFAISSVSRNVAETEVLNLHTITFGRVRRTCGITLPQRLLFSSATSR